MSDIASFEPTALLFALLWGSAVPLLFLLMSLLKRKARRPRLTNLRVERASGAGQEL
jgi:hypothetical protein